MSDRDDERREMILPPGVVRSRAYLPPAPSEAEGEEEGVKPMSAASRLKGRAARIPTPLSASEGGRGGGNRITAIEPQERRANRVSVFVDGKFALGVFDDVAATLGLRVGQQVTPERLSEIAGAETKRRALENAFLLLSFRARSEKEIADRLRRREYEEDVIATVIEQLRTAGDLDDAAFAEAWVRSRGKTRGRRALAYELRQKGVDATVVSATLAGDGSEGDDEAAVVSELSAARTVAVKKAGERPADRSREAQARLSAFLQRRGFGWDTIRPVLAELYGAAPETGDDGE